jgi:hypothetical protein
VTNIFSAAWPPSGLLFAGTMLAALSRPLPAAGKLAEDEKQKVKVQRLLIAMGARPEDLEEEAAAAADDGAVAANGVPDEAAPPMPAADGVEDMDANMDVDMDAGEVPCLWSEFCST